MIQIFDCAQNSPEWFECRRGIPTASMFATVMAKGAGKTRRAYLMKLADEIITGKPAAEGFSNDHTERGHEHEPEARALYEFQTGNQVQQVGFIRNGRKGASPDGLIRDDGGAEIKSKLPHLLRDIAKRREVPPAHKAQVQGNLWVTNRNWWEFVVYWPDEPLFIKRVYRDEPYIQKLATAVDRFNADLDRAVASIRGFGAAL